MKQILWGIFLCLGMVWAHKEGTNNNKLLSWEKLEIVLTYDEETKTIQLKGHAHHLNDTRIMVVLKFAGERFALESHTILLQNHQFEHTFGPYEDLTLIPGTYEVSCWFVMEQQTKEIQRKLLDMDFFHCNPPCRFDFQHYQMETISIGTDEEIEAEIKKSEEHMTQTVRKITADATKTLQIFRNAEKNLQNITDETVLVERLGAIYTEIDNLHYSVRELELDLIEYREERAFIYYMAVYERLIAISGFLEVFKNAIKRCQVKKNLKTLTKMSDFSDNLEKELKLFPDLLKNNFVNEEPPPREGETHNKEK